MIAVMIKAGSSIFSGEWGVRFFPVLLSTAALYLIYKITEPQNEWLFIAIIVSIVPLHLLLNFAVPDVPLIFFAALFFFALKNYLASQGKASTLLLLVAVAGMFYSKYHVVLIILFTLLAAPVVFSYTSFYFILVAAVAAYVPHILWQYNHNFRSVKYHLAERNESSYLLKNSIDYVLGQLLMFGPLSSIPLLYSAFKCKVQNTWQRVLLFNLAGFLIFFFIMSYRGHIEPNWTSPCWIPFIFLSYKFLETRTGAWVWLKPVAVISLVGIIVTRVLLTLPYDGNILPVYNQFHKWNKWAAAVKAEAHGSPVIFLNSYQYPSEYMFYAHDTAFSHNTPYGRGNQFDYWHYEENMLGRKAMLVSPGWIANADRSIVTQGDTIPYKWIEYYGFGKVKFRLLDKPDVMKAGEPYRIRVVAENFYNNGKIPEKLSSLSPDICYLFDKPFTYMAPASTQVKFGVSNMNDTLVLNVTAPAAPGKYSFYFCFKGNGMLLSTNSERMNVTVTPR